MAEGPVFFDPPDMGAWCKVTFESCRKTAKGTGVMFNNALITKDDGTPISSGNLWMSNDDAALTQYQSPVWLMKRWVPGAPKGTKPEIIATLIDGAEQRALDDAPPQREGGWSGGGGSSLPKMKLSDIERMVTWCQILTEKAGYKAGSPASATFAEGLQSLVSMAVDRSEWALPEQGGDTDEAAPSPPEAPPADPPLPGVNNVPEVPVSNTPPKDEEDISF